MSNTLFGMVHLSNGQSTPLSLQPQTFKGLIERIYPDSGAPVHNITLNFKDSNGQVVLLEISESGIALQVDSNRLL